MQNEGINISFPEGFNQDKFELTVVNRSGEAAEIKDYEEKSKFHVSLASISKFVEDKSFSGKPSENTGVVLYNFREKTLFLSLDSNNSMATELTAKLEMNPDLLLLGINKGSGYTADGLKQLVRKVAHLFADSSQPAKLIGQLQNHEVKFESNYKVEDDRKGNSSAYKQNVLKMTEGALNLVWDLRCPFFKGTKPVEFQIEIEIDVKDSRPVYSFWSLGLQQEIELHAENLISEQVEKLKNTFVCLETV